MEEKDSEELFMEELKNEFLENTSDSLKRRPELFESNDFMEIRKIAHDIKGTAGIFKMDKGSKIGMELQDAVDRKDSNDVKRLIDELILYMRNAGVDI